MSTDQQTTTDPEVAAYARRVRQALADVPAARLEELLEDLEEHLVEVASETPGPLADRLGPPEDYAAELRRAAGLAEAPAGSARTGWRRELEQRWGLLAGSASAEQVRSFLPELRPAWWVVRGWAAVAAVEYVFLGDVSLPLPTLGIGVFGWLLTAAAVVWSVRLGLRSRAAARPLGHAAAAVNLALAVCALVAVGGLADRVVDGFPEPASSYDSGPTTLTHEDGTPITNIVPYSTDGEPLDGVLLYDQDGRPIDNLAEYTADGDQVTTVQEVPPQPANAYPRQQQVVTHDEYGMPVTEQPVRPTPSPPAPGAGAELLPSAPVPPTPGVESGPAPAPVPTP